MRRTFEAVTAVLRGLAARARPCCCSTTCTTRAWRPSSCCTTSPGTPAERGCSCWPPSGPRRAQRRARTRWPTSPTGSRSGPLPADAVRQARRTTPGRPSWPRTILRRTRGHTLFVVETLRGAAPPASAGCPSRCRPPCWPGSAGSAAGDRGAAAGRRGARAPPSTRPSSPRCSTSRPHVAAQRCEEARGRSPAGRGRPARTSSPTTSSTRCSTRPRRRRPGSPTTCRAADLLDRPAGGGRRGTPWRRRTGRGPRAASCWPGEQAMRALRDRRRRGAAGAGPGRRRTGRRRRAARARLPGQGPRPRGPGRRSAARWRTTERALVTARQAGDRRLRDAGRCVELGGARIRRGRACRWPSAPAGLYGGAADRRVARGPGDRGRRCSAGWPCSPATGCGSTRRSSSAGRAVRAARASGSDRALADGLDGLKNVYAYLGEADALRRTLDELRPLLRRLGDLKVPAVGRVRVGVPRDRARGLGGGAAAGRGDAVSSPQPPDRATRAGSSLTSAGWPACKAGWTRRCGTGGTPVDLVAGRRSGLVRPATEPMLAGTLVELGDARRGASRCSRRPGGTPSPDGAEAYQLRCLAPLAEVTRRPGRAGRGGRAAGRDLRAARRRLVARRRRLPVGRPSLAAAGANRPAPARCSPRCSPPRSGWTGCRCWSRPGWSTPGRGRRPVRAVRGRCARCRRRARRAARHAAASPRPPARYAAWAATGPKHPRDSLTPCARLAAGCSSTRAGAHP